MYTSEYKKLSIRKSPDGKWTITVNAGQQTKIQKEINPKEQNARNKLATIKTTLIRAGITELDEANKQIEESGIYEDIEYNEKTEEEKEAEKKIQAEKDYINFIEDWKEAKEQATELYRRHETAHFPETMNFEGEITLMTESSLKETLMLVTPYKKGTKKGLRFFDEFKPKGATELFSESISKKFYEYKTIYDDEEIIVFSEKRIDKANIRIKGLKSELRDIKRYGNQASVPTTKNIIIAKEILEPKIELEEVINTLEKIETKDGFIHNYFGVQPQPEWFEKLICAWNLSRKGLYPAHLLVSDWETEKTGDWKW